MCTIIIYCRDPKYLPETLNDLIDKTSPTHLTEIIICDESGTLEKDKIPLNDWDKIIHTKQSGKSKAYNQAAQQATANTLVFLQSPAKFNNNWLSKALKHHQDKTIISPVARTFNPQIWSYEHQNWKRFGLRWNFGIYDQKPPYKYSPIAAHCLIIQKQFFNQLGGFVNSFDPTGGEDICLSLKAWFQHGKIIIAEDSEIGIIPEVVVTSNNILRMIHAWFPRFENKYCSLVGVDRLDQDDPELDEFLDTDMRDYWLKYLQPDLLDLYELFCSATDKTVAIIGDGPSIDYVDSLFADDIIIVVDRLFDLMPCDFVVTNLPEVISKVSPKRARLVVPSTVSGVPSDILSVETEEMVRTLSVAPPFCDFGGNMVLLAVHFALFLNPKRINLFGFDNKILDGVSHTRYIDGGDIWEDTEDTRQKFLVYEYGLRQLGDLAIKLNIPLIRIGHA